MPFVLVGKRNIENLSLFCVTSDYRHGARSATEHLVKQGRKRILFIRGIPNSYHEEEKLRGYKEILEEENIPFRHDFVIDGNAEQEQAYDKVKDLLVNGVEFDAVFAGNDLMAFGTINAVKEQGLRVPEDISVVGYDDIQSAATFQPALSTVRQNKLELGKQASQLLLTLLDEKVQQEAKTIVVDNELIVRESS